MGNFSDFLAIFQYNFGDSWDIHGMGPIIFSYIFPTNTMEISFSFQDRWGYLPVETGLRKKVGMSKVVSAILLLYTNDANYYDMKVIQKILEDVKNQEVRRKIRMF